MSVIWIKNKLIYFQTKNNVLILICQMFLFCWILLCCPKHSELAFPFRKLRQLQEKRKFTKWIKETKKILKNHKVNQGKEKEYAKIRKINRGNEKIFKLFWILGLQRKCRACNMGIELREFMINQNQCFWHRQLHSWEDDHLKRCYGGSKKKVYFLDKFGSPRMISNENTIFETNLVWQPRLPPPAP